MNKDNITKLRRELSELETQRESKRQELRAAELAGAFYVLHSPGGFRGNDGQYYQDPTAPGVTRFDSPRAALESLPVNPVNGDPSIKRVLNGAIDSTFRADYIVPNNRRVSVWRNDWKFYDESGEL